MLKKLICLVFSCVFFVAMTVGASAAAPSITQEPITISTETTVLPNGDTLTTIIRVMPSYSRGSTHTVPADKSFVYKTSEGTAWEFTIYGNFTYDGTTAKASSHSNDYNIYIDRWSCSKHTSSASGASVKGSCTFTSTSGLTKSKSLTLTCSPDGEFS